MSRAACLVSAKNWTKNFLFKFKAASTLYTRAIWERSFISTFRAAVNINSSRKQLFENTFQTEGIWRRQLFVFVWTRCSRVTIIKWLPNWTSFPGSLIWERGWWLPSANFPQTQINPKWAVIVAFLSFSGVVWTANIWAVFRVKPPFQSPPA